MNKKIIYAVMLAGLLFTGGLISVTHADDGLINPLGDTKTILDLLTKIAGGVGTLIASLGVIMLIIAGILFLLSAGSPEKIGTAKKALIYALVGIFIGLAATAIVGEVKHIIGVS